MDYFGELRSALLQEKEEDRKRYHELTDKLPVQERRAIGVSWFPVAIRNTELGRGDYLTVEVERTTHTDVIHQLRFGMTATLFSNFDSKNDRVEGVLSYISGNRLKITLRTDELPEWSKNGKLGIDAVFDENSYREMEHALTKAAALCEKKEEGRLVRVLTGEEPPAFSTAEDQATWKLNSSQQAAVARILSANELTIVHGPPGTGKTTTLVQAIGLLANRAASKILVTAPSNAAVDLLSQKLSEAGLNVVRIGNPARISERLMALTLDHKIAAHSQSREMKRLKKQAAEYRDLAHKYKRKFGPAEQQQRKALFAEARNISKEIENTERYIIDDVLSKAEVVTATLVGANHYTVKNLQYDLVVIDEAAQALEPACWVVLLKAPKVVMAGDHQQLPPTLKSAGAAAKVLSTTLMEKLITLYPEAVVMLQEQYRMHDTIMSFSSEKFYNKQLQAHASVAAHLLFAGDQPLVYIDTAGCGFEEKREGTNLSNPEEAALLVKYLSDFLIQSREQAADDSFGTVAVVSPYKHQVELLKEYISATPGLQTFLNAIAVNTIDSFQGQERDVVCISLVRSNAENSIGFLSEIRRMNVAMTRARKKLIVIGDSATLAQLPFYDDFIEYAQRHDAYTTAWEFMG
jgi:superfamily I DNA and/or RNA helicase